MTEASKPAGRDLAGLEQYADDLRSEIDRRKASEAELSGQLAVQTKRGADSEELFRLLVESVRDYALFMLDPDGNVATWNIGAQRIKGYAADEIIGRHFSAFYSLAEAASGKCDHELTVAAREGRFEEEGWRVRKDGSTFWASVVISAVHDRSGALIGFSKITRDLTDRRRAERDLAARLAAEHANRAKDEFLAMLGHELRNPMAPILTALELLRLRGAESSKEHEVIERQVKHMMHLIDDLLDVSRITSGKVEIKKRRIDLRDVIAKALETTSPLLEHKHHRIDVDLPPGDLNVDGDDTRLIQVFTNLLTNAAKYTDPGGQLRVSARIEGGEAVIEVRDNGIGISPELLPRVFELFIQGQQTFERAAGGLGLGLTLVRTLIGLHGGTVSAHSQGIGHGSTFTVRLPVATHAAITAAPAPHKLSSIKQAPRRILIVDDNDDARMLLAEILTMIGHHVVTAADGIEALKVAKEHAPEIAILDLGLPVMDGFELAATLRAELAGAVPRLIALTGYGQQNDRERTRAAGFDAHLVKPVDMQRLIASITMKS